MAQRTLSPSTGLLLLVLFATACNDDAPVATAIPAESSAGSFLPAPEERLQTCGDGTQLLGTLTGAIETSFNASGNALDCESMRRPDTGARLRFVIGDDDERLSLIVALPELQPAVAGRELASNVTISVEGSGRFFSTADLGTCWTDVHDQASLAEDRYLVSGEVYCIAPLVELNGDATVTIVSLSFVSILNWSNT